MILRLIFWCWYLFLFIWVIALFTNKRTVKRQSTLSRLRYSALFFLAFWLLFGSGAHHLHYPFELRRIIIPQSDALDLIGLVVTGLGLSLAIWARTILGRNWSGDVTFKENHELIERGPYALVRHPIYTAMLLMYLGTALAIGTYGALLGFPILYLSFWIKYRQEETLMIEHFGDRYRTYMTRVSAIIPYLF